MNAAPWQGAALLAATVSGVFVVLGGWHVYWALGGHVGLDAAVPAVDGRPLFRPGRVPTLAVGLALLGCATLMAVPALRPASAPGLSGAWVATALALAMVLLARAIGDFRWVGFFKHRAQSGRFATLDTWVYSPLCLALSSAIAVVVRAVA